MLAATLAGAGLSALGACAPVAGRTNPPRALSVSGAELSTEALADKLRDADYLLLGEVHDNPQGHAARHRLLQSATSDTRSVVLLFEHFDLDREAALQAARKSSPRDVDAWIAAGGPANASSGSSWPWALLRPVLELARDRGFDVRAANTSRAELRAISREPFPDSPLSAAGLRRLRETLEAGHCGMLQPAQLDPLIRSQQWRDRRMAEAMRAARTTGTRVVLLAGNGHVRRDFGAPVHLARLDRWARTASVGFIERPASAETDEALYDYVFVVEPHERPDPCEAFRRREAAPGR